MPPRLRCHVAGLNSGLAREPRRSCVRRLNALSRGMRSAAGKWGNQESFGGENNKMGELKEGINRGVLEKAAWFLLTQSPTRLLAVRRHTHMLRK